MDAAAGFARSAVWLKPQAIVPNALPTVPTEEPALARTLVRGVIIEVGYDG